MKNKKITTLLIAFGMIACTGLGFTLAYMTAKTETLKNQFTYSDGIRMTLDEDKVDPEKHTILEENAVIAGENEGNQYLNVVSNEILPKDPTVTIGKDSPDCYVFVSVKNPSKDYLKLNISNNWHEVASSGDTVYYAYFENNIAKVIEKSTEDTRINDPVFTTVTVGDVSTDTITALNNIEVRAAAVQAKFGTSYDFDSAKHEALDMLGYKGN